MRITAVALSLCVLLFGSGVSSAELVGKKECAKGAIESGGKLLQQCVDAPDSPKEAVITEAPYSLPEGGSNYQIVTPEVTTVVNLSSTDVNRVTCMQGEGEVNVVYSAEKGMITKVVGRDIFIKFNVIKKTENGKETNVYTTVPTEMYIVCGGEVYSLVAVPQRIPSQMVKLSTGKKETIKKNLSMFAGIPFERKIIDIVKYVYTDSIPESFTVEVVKKPVDLFNEIGLVLERVVKVEGEGIEVKEFSVRVKPTAKVDSVNLTEKNFLKPELTGRGIIAISLDKHNIAKSDRARLFIVEGSQNER